MSKDPLTEILDAQVHALEGAAGQLGTDLWEFRVEMGWLAAVALVYLAVFATTGHDPVVAGVYVFLGIVFLFVAGRKFGHINPRLRLLRRSLDASRLRRRWDKAIRHCGFAHPIPISKIQRDEGGYHARIRVGWGISLRDLQIQKERLAASVGIGELWIDRDPENAATGTARLTIVVPHDYLAGAAKAEWPV